MDWEQILDAQNTITLKNLIKSQPIKFKTI